MTDSAQFEKREDDLRCPLPRYENSNIAKEMSVTDAVLDNSVVLMQKAMAGEADLKHGKLASESMGRANAAVKNSINTRMLQGKLTEIDARVAAIKSERVAEQATN